MSSDDAVTGAIVGAIAGVFVLFLAYKVYRRYRPRAKKSKSIKNEKRKAAFSVGGNLVKELDTPITDNYDIAKTLLGRGSSAEVVIGIHLRTQRRYAVKIIDISNHEVEWRYDREKNYLKDIDHTNVVRLYEVYRSPVALFFVMELCTGGHLGQILKASPTGHLPEDTAKKYILQLTRAIVHIHKNGICHRDIKLQNILMENNTSDAQIKLVDFGNAVRYKGHTPMKKVVGTTYTAAPEVFRECYDERCDVWSMGVVAYILLSGRRPFESLSAPGEIRTTPESEVKEAILRGHYHFKHAVWDEVEHDAMHFITCCLEPDYTKRKSAAQLLDHPWLQQPHDSMNDSFSTIGVSQISEGSAYTLKKSLKRNMSQFSGMRHASMLAVAFSMPTVKMQQLRDLFQELDKNGSGTLEKEEFHAAMRQVNPEMSTQDIHTLFNTLDLDGNHNISFMEFMAATVDPREVDMQEMAQAFRLLDTGQKGYLTKEDLLRVLQTTDDDDLHELANNRGGAVTVSTRSGVTSSSNGHSHHSTGHGTGHSHDIGNRVTLLSAFGSRSNDGNSNNNINNAVSEVLIDDDTTDDGNPSIHINNQPNNNLPSNNNTNNNQPNNNNNSSSVNQQTPAQQTAKAQARRFRKLTQRISRIIEQADVNHDGVVSFPEFLFAMAEGSGVTGNEHYEALAHEPQLLLDGYNENDRAHHLPGFNKKLVDKQGGRRQTDQVLNLRGRTFLTRKRTIFTNSNNSLKDGDHHHNGGNHKHNQNKGDTWLAYIGSFLPRTVQETILPVEYHSDKQGSNKDRDRVEHRGKGLHMVSHIDDSPTDAQQNRTKGRKISLFGGPIMLGRKAKARSSPALPTKNNLYNNNSNINNNINNNSGGGGGNSNGSNNRGSQFNRKNMLYNFTPSQKLSGISKHSSNSSNNSASASFIANSEKLPSFMASIKIDRNNTNRNTSKVSPHPRHSPSNFSRNNSNFSSNTNNVSLYVDNVSGTTNVANNSNNNTSNSNTNNSGNYSDGNGNVVSRTGFNSIAHSSNNSKNNSKNNSFTSNKSISVATPGGHSHLSGNQPLSSNYISNNIINNTINNNSITTSDSNNIAPFFSPEDTVQPYTHPIAPFYRNNTNDSDGSKESEESDGGTASQSVGMLSRISGSTNKGSNGKGSKPQSKPLSKPTTTTATGNTANTATVQQSTADVTTLWDIEQGGSSDSQQNNNINNNSIANINSNNISNNKEATGVLSKTNSLKSNNYNLILTNIEEIGEMC